ncbi:MAG: YdcF family protein [Cyclobacteriaceae bacterium]|nr:YdcF family protein [Cyclobacteriaceae bacterium SS2]
MNFSRVLKIGALTCTAVAAILLTVNFWIVNSTVHKIHYTTDLVPRDRVGLILGTSKRTIEGHNNLYFDQRIDAAARLYRSGHIRKIIVSGDNRTQFYNEPKDMLNALLAKGIPEGVIVLDPEGVSTLDSVVRSKWVYGSDKILIITQDFHCYRALFIADHFGIDAQAYSADQKGELSSTLATREVLARIKAVFDLYISKETPQYAVEN